MKKSNSGGKSGKGDKPRNCFSKEYKENFGKINWKKMKCWSQFFSFFEHPPIEKVYLYPEHLNELVCALMEEQVSPEDYMVSDESMVSDFWILGGELPKTILKLQKKYGLKELKMEDYIWEVVEKMYQNRPLR